MKNDIRNSHNLSLISFFLLLYLSLIAGFYLGEDSNGGAYLDYYGQKNVSESFAVNFKQTLLDYDNFATRHSPILIIFLSFFEKLNFNDELIRIIHLHICMLLPFSFYLVLREKFKDIEKIYLTLIVGLIFLSPTFRSLSIWPDSRLLGLSIFTFSILFFLYFLRTKSYKYTLLNVIFCSLASYISPNFSVFAIYFFYFFVKEYGLLNKKIIYIITLNIALSIPAIYYLFFLEINFLTKTAVIKENKNFAFYDNLANQILIISSIILFYLIPFIITKYINLKFDKILIKLIICLFVVLICINYFDYKFEYTGGGIFFKISFFLFKNNYLFYFISFVSLFFLSIIFSNKFENYFIFLLLILSNPQISIYHKYYDPFLIILLFSLLEIELKRFQFKKIKNNIVIYLYFLGFLIVSFLK